jgi:hypothetical protein
MTPDGPRPWAPARRPQLIRVERPDDDVASLLRRHGVPLPVPVVVLVGGASGLDDEASRRCDVLLRSAIVPALEGIGACLVDGGTDSGVIALAGRARHDAGAVAPYVGVVAEGTVHLPGGEPHTGAELEPHHTHIVVVPGSDWGDEAAWLALVATAVAGPEPSVTILANGGDVAYDDVAHSLSADRTVLVLAGTGRTADAVAAACAGKPADPRAVRVAASGLVRPVPFDVGAVTAALLDVLQPR